MLARDFADGLTASHVVVTGGSGFIGTNLVNAYRAAGVRVTNIDVSPPRDRSASDLWRPTDLTSPGDVRDALEETAPTHVLHLGARTDLDGRSVNDYAANVSGVQHLLEAVRGTTIPLARLIVASSRLVCRIGHQPVSDTDYFPNTAYGESKIRTEQLVRACDDLPWVLVRPTSIWGPWFDVPYRDFFLHVVRGRYVHPRGALIKKSFGYVENTIWQLHRLLVTPDERPIGRTFYLADDPPIEVGAFAKSISDAAGTKRPREVPLSVLRTAAKAGDAAKWAKLSAPLTSFRLDNLLTPMIYDTRELQDIVGPARVQSHEGVAATLAWMREHGLIGRGA